MRNLSVKSWMKDEGLNKERERDCIVRIRKGERGGIVIEKEPTSYVSIGVVQVVSSGVCMRKVGIEHN